MRPVLSFKEIIDPVSPELFFKEYYEKKFLHVSRNNPLYFNNVLNVDDIGLHLQNKLLRLPTISLVNNGNMVHESLWSKDRTLNGVSLGKMADNDKVFDYFNTGCTITLNDAHRYLGNLINFCTALEKELKFRVQTNIYITPPGAQGFDIHYDTHDVFALQVFGTKQWKLYDMTRELPLDEHKADRDAHIGKTPQDDFLVHPGDVLYIPRGLTHAAVSTDHVSIHITLGFLPYKGTDLVNELHKSSKERLFFRKSRPHGFSTEQERKEYKLEFEKELRLLVAENTTEQLLEKTEQKFFEEKSSDDSSRFLDLTRINDLNLNSVLCRRKSILLETSNGNGEIKVSWNKKNIALPVFLAPSVNFVLNNDKFLVKDIQGLIDDKGKVDLCKKFISDGILCIESVN